MKPTEKSGAAQPHLSKARHLEMVEAVALGAAAGAATGIVGGPPGIVAGGVVGAVVGTLAGSAIERAARCTEAHDRQLDEEIGVTQGSLGAREAATEGLEAFRSGDSSADTARRSRAELLAEHAELEVLVEELQGAVRAGDCKTLIEPWRRFERGLADHMAVEESELLPAYARSAPDEARKLVETHASIRALVDELAILVELHCIRAEQVDELLSALRAHRIAEEAAFYRWVEQGEQRA